MPSLEQLHAALAQGPPEVRRGAVEALGRMRDWGAVDLLTRALGDTEVAVRNIAVRALAELHDARIVDPFIRALADTEAVVRRNAVKALGALNDARTVDPLIKALADADAEVRIESAKALGALKDRRAVDPLVKALGDASGEVGAEAANALGALEDTRAVDALVRGLDDAKEIVRRAAASALGALKDTRAVEPLVKALCDEDSCVRQQAARALAELGDPGWQTLVCGEDDDPGRLAQALDPRGIEALFVALRNTRAQSRATAARGLGARRDARVVDALIVALGDDQGIVRAAAAEALGAQGDPRAIDPLINVLWHSGYVFPAAIRALAVLDGPQWGACACPAFVLFPSDHLEELAKSGVRRAVEPLIKILERDPSYFGRMKAAKALGALQDSRGMDPLVHAAYDVDGQVRKEAAEALAALGDPRWQGWIKGDEQDFERLRASGEPQATEARVLVSKLLARRGQERKEAATALARIANENPAVLHECWTRVRDMVVAKHHDANVHDDNGKQHNWRCPAFDDHRDSPSHEDRGIGLEFPEPKSGVSPDF